MARIDGLGAWRPGDFLRDLPGGPQAATGGAITPESSLGGGMQATDATLTNRSVSMTRITAQFGELIAGLNSNSQQTQMIQALVALIILIALLEQLEQGSQTGSRLLEALSLGRGSGGVVAGSYFASSYVAYEQTMVTMTTSSGGAGAAGEQATDQSQIDVTA